MKNKSIIAGLVAIFIGSCSSPKYLPSPDKIDVNQYGSYIKIIRNNETIVKGELIAVETHKIVVLSEVDTNNTKEYVVVPIKEIQRFKLRYAKQKHYGWTIPVFTLATISHGYFLIATAPVNLIVTTSVTIGSESAFTYSDKNMTYTQLEMFARFPQGIPPGTNIPGIK